MGFFGNLLNGVLSVSQMNQQKSLQEEQWRREDTAISRQINDARRNGINPLTALGQQGFGSNTDISSAMAPFDSMKNSVSQSETDKTNKRIARMSAMTSIRGQNLDNEIKKNELEQRKLELEQRKTEFSKDLAERKREYDTTFNQEQSNFDRTQSEIERANQSNEQIQRDYRSAKDRIINDIYDAIDIDKNGIPHIDPVKWAKIKEGREKEKEEEKKVSPKPNSNDDIIIKENRDSPEVKALVNYASSKGYRITWATQGYVQFVPPTGSGKKSFTAKTVGDAYKKMKE